jgi:hypothetical protein
MSGIPTYAASIRFPNGSIQKVTVQADNSDKARAMLETQYGKGNVSNVQRKIS